MLIGLACIHWRRHEYNTYPKIIMCHLHILSNQRVREALFFLIILHLVYQAIQSTRVSAPKKKKKKVLGHIYLVFIK